MTCPSLLDTTGALHLLTRYYLRRKCTGKTRPAEVDATGELADADLELMLVRQGLELGLHHAHQPRQQYPAVSRDLVACLTMPVPTICARPDPNPLTLKPKAEALPSARKVRSSDPKRQTQNHLHAK